MLATPEKDAGRITPGSQRRPSRRHRDAFAQAGITLAMSDARCRRRTCCLQPVRSIPPTQLRC